MPVSTVPAAIDALVAAIAAALPGVQVVDGQPIATEDDVIAVAFTGLPGEAGVEMRRAQADLSYGSDQESYDIVCLASAWTGGTDPKKVRDRAYELIEAVAAEVARDRTLGGTVAQAGLSTDSFAQEQTTKGAVATVRFVVHVEAFTGPV